MLKKVKSVYILRKVFLNIYKGIILKLVTYNNNLQKKLDLSIDDYIKQFNQIKVELIPEDKLNQKENKFINRIMHKSHYHIFFNGSREEIDREYFTSDDKVSKIIILIDEEVTSLEGLFYKCISIKEIQFITFNRNNIFDMSSMFTGCKNLINLNISKFKTENTIDMSYMFRLCEKLNNLDISSFKTINVIDMRYMFNNCKKITELNLSNFQWNSIKYMNFMFYGCNQLMKLNISNFNANTYSYEEESLTTPKINIKKIQLNKIFGKCPLNFKKEIKKQMPLLGKEAFID